MRVRQPPHRLVEVDVLQPELNDGEDEDHRLKEQVAVARQFRDVRMLGRHDQRRKWVRVILVIQHSTT